MKSANEKYGIFVFNDKTMRERLPKETYKELKATIDDGKDMNLTIANVIANAMKDWAVEQGATHYTHWFQPLTGSTAEKHDSFVSPNEDGTAIMEFSGKELIKGEPDASSFPSGGLRATFEARGYTAWDPTSFAFIKERTLCIPTAFCSYSGEALDKKTPLLRSMEVLNEQALRILRILGDKETKKVVPTVGLEQEYFLLDKEVYKKRKDLVYCGRTLFGAKPPKGQELDDHYFGAIKPRVGIFMKTLDEELWKFGVPAKTCHNEAAPSQHEMAPLYTTVNVGVDQNQLVMEIMKKVADRLGLVCLLHEKPFARINGSGKHNNWSLQTNNGVNLLEPGDSPCENIQFLLLLTALIEAVDSYPDLLRVTVASATNDYRLGGNEAPPAIISMFIGYDLDVILSSISQGIKNKKKVPERMVMNANVIPNFSKDATDRNRTSPFAFTANKFEFRMLGSSANAAGPNIVIDTIVAEVLQKFADILEKSDDVKKTVYEIIGHSYKEHKKIIFNGNNYSEEWIKEAEIRGLRNRKTTVDAAGAYLAKENIELFEKYHILSKKELLSRYEVTLDNYSKTLNIEALTMLDMVHKKIIPGAIEYMNVISDNILKVSAAVDGIECNTQKKLLSQLAHLVDCISVSGEKLHSSVEKANSLTSSKEQAEVFRDEVIKYMEDLRVHIDSLELIVAKKYWPYPPYGDLLFSV